MENKDFVEYEEALELKQLGFDEPCLKFYATEKLVLGLDTDNGDTNSKLSQYNPLFISAPTYSQAFRWFRENYELEVVFSPDSFNKEELKLRQYKIISYSKKWVLEKYVDQSHWTRKGCFKTYEEAELACLKKLIEIVKQNDQIQNNN